MKRSQFKLGVSTNATPLTNNLYVSDSAGLPAPPPGSAYYIATPTGDRYISTSGLYYVRTN